MSARETEINAVNPFINEHPFLLDGLKRVHHNNEWWLQDEDRKLMRLQKQFPQLWKLLSISGGKPLATAVIGKENEYRPLGVWLENEYIIV